MAVIALGADHAGFTLKQDLRAWLIERGHRVIDCGTHSTDSVDYPDFAALVARSVQEGGAGQGVLGWAIVEAWLETPFEGGRHARRVGKLAELDGARKEKAVDAAAR